VESIVQKNIASDVCCAVHCPIRLLILMAFRERLSQVTSVLDVSVIRQAPIEAATGKLGVMSQSLSWIYPGVLLGSDDPCQVTEVCCAVNCR
jgi:hypothetical protein